ncbi:MAG TPA: adenylate/guanylate cyclase domain-containing protein, partial [Candidatus Ozemobacteraceae bacterium]
LFAHSTAELARQRPRTIRNLLSAAPEMKRGRLSVFDEYLVFRESFSPQYPYDMLALAPLPRHTSPISGFLVAARAVLILSWGIIFLYVLVSGRPPPVSLRTMLRTLFLLVASLPLGMLATFGYLQISTETQRAIDAVETGAIDSLNALDILSRQSLGRFSRAAQRVFSSPTFIRNILSSAPADVASAAAECYSSFAASRETLNNVLIFQPGRQGRSFSPTGEDRDSVEKLDFFAGIVNLTHNSLISKFGRFGHSAIMLDTENQKSWRTIFESFGVLQFSDLFYSLMETGHMTSIGSEDIGLHVSQMFFSFGSPRAYILLNTPAQGSQKIFLTQEINRLNLQYPARHACGDVTPGGATPYQPAQNAGFWSTEPGRLLRQCMDHSALSDTPVTIRRGTRLAVAAPCRTLGPMVTASLWSLDDILATDAWNKALLALFTVLLGLLAYHLARLTADHLVTPLESVDRALRSVTSGNLTVRTGLARVDELGRMTVAFDEMIDGLRERRELGKFVSGAIESSLGREDMETSRAEAITGTILVSDIRSFTTMSESHPPGEIVALLNTHMEAMTAAILRHDGHIDRFIGDAVVALFRKPASDGGASAALAAAIEMNAETNRINQLRANTGSFTYAIGIGIATGDLMTGTLDGGRRRDFVVIGHPRSRAEILENLSKRGRHTHIIVDQETISLLSDAFEFEPLPREQASELVRRKEASA